MRAVEAGELKAIESLFDPPGFLEERSILSGDVLHSGLAYCFVECELTSSDHLSVLFASAVPQSGPLNWQNTMPLSMSSSVIGRCLYLGMLVYLVPRRS
jgi:hypothetical protein